MSFAGYIEESILTPAKLKQARRDLGYSLNDMADALRLSSTTGATTLRKMEAGKVNISGPIMVAVSAMLKGFDPFEEENEADSES